MSDQNENEISSSINRYNNNYVELSGTASGIARQLAFAEGAVFWILYSGTSSLSAKLLLCAFLLALLIYFVLDTVQYIYSAQKFAQLSETLTEVRKQNPRPSLSYEYPDYFAKASTTMYTLKFIFLLISSLLLVVMFAIFITNNTRDTLNNQINNQNNKLIEQKNNTQPQRK